MIIRDLIVFQPDGTSQKQDFCIENRRFIVSGKQYPASLGKVKKS